MAKRGSAYEQIVGSVCKALDPGATVKVSTRKLGPDGRRDMDVSISGTQEGKSFLGLVECKDWKRRVGIGVVDELESKRRDLHADMSAIYSNSGFTAGAVRKALRVGISLCSAMKAGDMQIRCIAERRFIARQLSVESWSLRAFWRKDRNGLRDPDPTTLTWNGLPLVNWISSQSRQLICEHPEKTQILAEYAFQDEVEFESCGQRVLLKALAIHLICTSRWMTQTVQLDVTLGSYDFRARRLIVPSGETLNVGPFVNLAWQPCEAPPPESPADQNSFEMVVTILHPVSPVPGFGSPNLDEFICERAITFPAVA